MKCYCFKLTVFLFLCCFVSILTAQQKQKISITIPNSNLEKALMEINKISSYEIQFFQNDVKNVMVPQTKFTEEDITIVLTKLLSGTNLEYSITGNTVVIKPKPTKEQQKAVARINVSGNVKDAQGEPMIGASIIVQGTQTIAITDLDGNYTIKNVPSNGVLQLSLLGYKTENHNVDGKATLNLILKEDTQLLDEVVVTGFQNIQKVNFTGSAVKVKSDDLQIKGSADFSRMLEGSVAGVSIQNVSGTFGSAPKIRVRGATSINGENKPLWVIDGVVHEDIVNISNDALTSGDPSTLLGSAVAGLNANDIASIDVLKDASATALYGARAMNGVIVVTTKRGSEGRPVINYSGNFSIQLKPTYDNYDIMNSMDQMSVYAELERKGFLTTNIVNWSNSGVYGKMYNNINTYDEKQGKFLLENTREARNQFLRQYAMANTDWFDILFKNSLIQEHSLSISGGSEKSRSYASLSFMRDGGWSVADGVNRYTANLRNDYQIYKALKLGVQVVGSVRQQEAPGSLSRISNPVEGSYDRDFDINPYSYALNTSRALRAYDENGNLEYFTQNYAPFNIINELDNNQIKLNVIDLKAQIETQWNLFSFLRWDFTGALRYVKSDREHEIREHSNMAEAYRAAGNSTIRDNNRFLYKDPNNPNAEAVVVLPYGGFYNRNESQLISYDFRNSLFFTKAIGKHNINALLGQQTKFADRQNFNMTGYGYQYDQGGIPFVDYKIMKQMIESNFDYYGMGKTSDRFVAFYLNADYSYDTRYVFSGTVRYDGSNGLGKSKSARWLPTWNVSAKWNASNEKFLQDAKWIDYLSLRASYGLTASMPSASNAAAVFYNRSTNRPYTDEIESVIDLGGLENSELTWEKGYLMNFGLDFSIFNRTFDITMDYWRRNSFDLISSFRTSGIGGETVKLANYADMKSSGIEVGIGLYPLKVKDFSWKINFTFGYSKNEITNAKNQPRIFDMVSPNGGSVEGYPVRSLFSVQYKGLDPETGIPTYLDENGNINNSVYLQSTNVQHLKYEGPVEPKYNGGWANTFKYKDLSLNVFFTFQGGNKIRLNNVFKNSYSDLDAMPNSFYDRWEMPGDEQYTNIPSIVDAYISSSQLSGKYPYNVYNYSDAMVAKGDFIRLKNISLSYNIPSHIIQKSKIFSKVAITLAASNLCLLYSDKKLNGQDPEFFNTGGVAQPLQKQFTVALNVGF